MTSPKPLAIIAVDPGKRTGVATYIENLSKSEYSVEVYEFDVDEFYDFIHSRIHTLCTDGYEVRLVAESFIITIHTAKNTQATWSLELIGVMKFLAHRYGLENVNMQAPAIGKTFGTNDKLKYLGWWRSGTIDGVRFVGHGNDAARHLATFAAQRRLIFTKDQLIDMAG